MTRLVKLTGTDDKVRHVNPDHVKMLWPKNEETAVLVLSTGTCDVQGTPAEVARLLAGGEGEQDEVHRASVLEQQRDQAERARIDARADLAVAQGNLRDMTMERDALAAEVERLKAALIEQGAAADAEVERLTAELLERGDQVEQKCQLIDEITVALGSQGLLEEELPDAIATLTRERDEARAALAALADSADELLEVASLRGDNELPHPADDDRLWTSRMADAWGELPDAIEQARSVLPAASPAQEPSENLLETALRALVLTHQYAPQTLPPLPGWEWYDAAVKLAAAVPGSEWAAQVPDPTPEPEETDEPGCPAEHEDGWLCTLNAGHDGEHVAHGLDGDVWATWTDDDEPANLPFEDDGNDGNTYDPSPDFEPAPATPTEPDDDPLGPVTDEELDAALVDLRPATPTTPTTTDIPLHSRITATAHGECVLQPETGPRGERVVFMRDDLIEVSAPPGLRLHFASPDSFKGWGDHGVVLGPNKMPLAGFKDGDELWFWTSDPTVDVNQHKDAKYADPCVLHVSVVPDGEEMPDFSDPYLGNVVWDANNVDNQSPLHSAYAKPDPAFFDPAKILAFVNTDPEAQRQIRKLGEYGNDTLHHRRHQEARAGTGLAGLCFNPEAALPGDRFTDGNHGWDALGDALLVLIGDNDTSAPWDYYRESVRAILRSKLIDNPLCQTPFGIVGKSWDQASPFRHWWGRAMYRSFVDVVDLGFGGKLLQDTGLLSAVLSPQDEAHYRSNFVRFAEFVDADMKAGSPAKMWRQSNCASVVVLRKLFPSLGLPDLLHWLDTDLLINDDGDWTHHWDYAGHNTCGIVFDVLRFVLGDAKCPQRIVRFLDRAAHKDEAQRPRALQVSANDRNHVIRNYSAVTPRHLITDIDPVSLGSQDHALYVVAGSRVAS